jgi:hypothetical protein
MNRSGVGLAATLFATSLVMFGTDAGWAGQSGQAPPMKSVLQGKKFTAPVRGQAEIEYTAPSTARVKDSVVTKIAVKNVSTSPIARLAINDTWYDKGGEVLTAGRGVINGLLQPGEVQTITIDTPFKPGMNERQRRSLFTHAWGDVKPSLVKSFDAPKESAASATKPAATTKKAPPKK